MSRFALRNWTVMARAVALSLFATVMPVLVLGVYTSSQARSDDQEKRLQGLTRKAVHTAEELVALQQRLLTSARSLAAAATSQALTPEVEPTLDLAPFARALIAADPDLLGLALLTPDHRVWTATDDAIVKRSLALQKRAPTTPATPDTVVLVDRSGPREALLYVVPIRRNDQLLATAVAHIGVGAFRRVLDRERKRSADLLELVDEAGTPIASALGNLTFPRPAAVPTVEARLQLGERAMVGAAIRLPGVPWTLYCLVPASELAALDPESASSWLQMALLTALGSMALSVLIAHRWTQPVRALDAVMHDLVAGRFEAKLKVDSWGPEFRRVSEGLAQLVAYVAAVNELEQVLQAKTAELEVANDQLSTQRTELDAQARDLALQREEMARTNEALARADRLKSQFLATMSHELRTPLNAVLGFTQLVLDDRREPIVPAHKGHLEYVIRSGKHLLELINDMLDLSKIEAGSLDLDLHSLALEHVLSEARDGVRALLVRDGIELAVTCTAREKIHADRRRLHQVLLNLLSNAIKFSPQGAKVELLVEEAGEHVRFSVRDYGPGIEAELRDRLFEPFAQGNSARNRKQEGTGLGLAISKRLVEGHGGQIGVLSPPGGGSLFWFTVRIALHHSARTSLVLREPLSTGPMLVAGRARPTIVVADDDDVTRALLRPWLERYGYRVFEAENGARALELVKSIVPSLVILDLKMPELDGYEALKTMRMNEPTRSIPVVAISASAMPEDEAQVKSAGFDGYLTKPIQRQVMGHLIAELLRVSA